MGMQQDKTRKKRVAGSHKVIQRTNNTRTIAFERPVVKTTGKLNQFYWYQFLRPSQGFWGTGNKAIYFRGTREQKSETKENKETKTIWGNRKLRKSRF